MILFNYYITHLTAEFNAKYEIELPKGFTRQRAKKAK